MKRDVFAVRFWGTRGSFPVGVSPSLLRNRMVEAIELSQGKALGGYADIEAFVDRLFPGKIPPLYGTNTSCVEITNDGGPHIICDAGSGLYSCGARLMKAGRGSGETYHIFVTHLHWDHIQGFPFFDPIYIPGNKVVVHGFHERLEEAFRLQMSEPFFPVPFDQLKADISFEVHDCL
ncbi:MAG: MBL fold metallo-hydrolase, partial [Bdellovibrionales bacterium]|nr:MBL fold metallo-hydrolase [Bdellovibrionales bacterium]